MKRLEIIFQSRGVVSDDSQYAEQLAAQLGFPVEIVYPPPRGATKGENARQRRQLVNRLREKKWSNDRIARALHCAVRTVERLVSRKPKIEGRGL